MDKLLARHGPGRSGFAVPFLVGFACAAVLLHLVSWPSSTGAALKARAPAKGTFWLVVQVTFKSEKDVATFESAFAPLAHHVQAHEPGTVSYAYARSDSDPLKILIFERYQDKERDYLQVHRSSAPFLKFRPTLAALDAKVDGHSYIEGGFGFV